MIALSQKSLLEKSENFLQILQKFCILQQKYFCLFSSKFQKMSDFLRIDYWLFTLLIILLGFGVWMMSSVSVFNSYQKESPKIAGDFCIESFVEEIQTCQNNEGMNYAKMVAKKEFFSSYEESIQKESRKFCIENSEKIKICKEKEGFEYAKFWCAENNCNDRYLKLHIRNMLVGIAAMIFTFLLPFAVWRYLSIIVFGLAFALLLLVLFLPQSGEFTSRSWLILPVIGSFQPSELMKLGLILYFSFWMEKKEREVKTLSSGFIPFVLLVGVATAPVMAEPDFGATAILVIIASAIFFVAGGHWTHFAYAALLGGIFIAFVASAFGYVRQRLITFLDPEKASEAAKYQIEQAHLSIGNGGMFGAGDSTQSFGFLPEIQGDMVFAAIAEQIGFVGLCVLIGVYIFIAIRGIIIAKNAPDRFSMLVAIGITAWFSTQSLINMMVVTGLFPLTGITLPLLSYGGSSLMMSLAAFGILFKISSLSHENSVSRRRNSWSHFSSFVR